MGCGTSFGHDWFGEKTEGLFLASTQTLLVQGTPRDQNFCLGPTPPLVNTIARTSEPCLTPRLLACPPLHLSLPIPLSTLLPPLPVLLLFYPWPAPSPPLSRAPPRAASAAAAAAAGPELRSVCSVSPLPAPSRPGDQERAELAAGRRHLEARQALYAELQTQLDNCPESVREQLQEQLRRVSSTSPPFPPPRPPGGEERRAGTAWALQFLPDARVGAVAWRGQGRIGGVGGVSFLLLQAVLPVRGAKPSGGKGVGWGQVPSSASPPAPRTHTSVTWPSGPRGA